MSDARSLSPREAEVLVYLARGFTPAYTTGNHEEKSEPGIAADRTCARRAAAAVTAVANEHVSSGATSRLCVTARFRGSGGRFSGNADRPRALPARHARGPLR